MEILKIRPKKITITVFLIFFIGTIIFGIILLTKGFKDFLYCIIIGIPISVLMAALNYIMHGIIVQDSEIIINMDGAKGYKKYRINLKDINKLKYGSAKALFGSTMYFFIIFFNQDQEEMFFRINDNIYYINELKELFEYLQSKYKIPLEILNSEK